MVPVKLKTFVGVTFVVLTAIFLHWFGVLQPVEGFLRRIIRGPSSAVYHAAVTSDDGAGALCKNEHDTVTLALLTEENQTLRRQLGFLSSAGVTYVSADVIGRNVEPIGSTLVINRGSKDGMRKGQAVIVDDGIFIGKIERVEDDMAIVQLVSDGKSRVAATIMNRDRSIGIVEGGYGISVRMNFIPQHEALSPGDIIITSGLEEGVPRGLIIGAIEAVEKEAYQPFQRAALTTRAKLDRVTLVSVITL